MFGRVVLQKLRLSPFKCNFLSSIERSVLNKRECTTCNDEVESLEDKSRMVYHGAKSLNEVKIIGYIGKDPSQMHAETHMLTTFSVATHKHFFNSTTGIEFKSTTWHNILVKDRLLQEYTMKVLCKGSRVYISGFLSNKIYSSEIFPGSRTPTHIVAQEIMCFRRGLRKDDNYIEVSDETT